MVGLRRWLPVCAVIILVAASLLLIVSVPVLSHATSTSASAVGTVMAIGCLVLGSLIGVAVPRTRSAGTLLTFTAIALLAPIWVGWQEGPSAVRGVAALCATLLPAVLVHLLLLRPDGRLGRARTAVITVYAVVGGLTIALVAFRDPFFDRYCWNDCTAGTAIFPWIEGARAAGTAIDLVSLTLGAGALAFAIARGARAMRSTWMWVAAVTFPSSGALAAIAAGAALHLANPAETRGAVADRAYQFETLALATIGIGVAIVAMAKLRQRAATSRLIQELGATPQPGALRSAFSRLLGDDHLEVAYWLPRSERFVDTLGRPVDPGVAVSTIAIRRRGELIALLMLSHTIADEGTLPDQIGSAARLAIDNERLQAELAAQLSEITASRARVVESSDRTRRQIERDLHDGAQAALVAALYTLAVAGSENERTGAHDRADALARLSADASEIVQSLRRLTRGIYPSVLDELGLEAALSSLADDSTTPVRLDIRGGPRPPAQVERAAYLVVARALEEAGRHSSGLEVTTRHDEEALRITVVGGHPRPSIDVLDRVGALGGEVVVVGDRMQAVIPCA